MVSIQSFGAFVKLQDSGVEGLVHVSQIKAGYIGAVSDEVAVGDEVQVRCYLSRKNGRRTFFSFACFLATNVIEWYLRIASTRSKFWITQLEFNCFSYAVA